MGDGRDIRNTTMLLALGPPHPCYPSWIRHVLVNEWNSYAIDWLIDAGYCDTRSSTTWFIDDFYTWFDETANRRWNSEPKTD